MHTLHFKKSPIGYKRRIFGSCMEACSHGFLTIQNKSYWIQKENFWVLYGGVFPRDFDISKKVLLDTKGQFLGAVWKRSPTVFDISKKVLLDTKGQFLWVVWRRVPTGFQIFQRFIGYKRRVFGCCMEACSHGFLTFQKKSYWIQKDNFCELYGGVFAGFRTSKKCHGNKRTFVSCLEA